jgi:serine protease Do
MMFGPNPSARARWVAVALALFAAGFVGVAAAPAGYAQARLPPEGFADLVEQLTPAVVNIATTQRVDGLDGAPRFPRGSPLEQFNDELGEGPEVTSLGSGFLISADGLVVTNDHVVASADTIEVILQSGEQLPARIVGRDPATDLAVLQVSANRALPFVAWGDSDGARVGDLVIAIGNPFGLGGTVTLGIISARNRNIEAGRFDDFIQTDAAINRGNSGGPLFNMRGQVIGVNTAIVSPTGGSVGVGFATPASLASTVVDQLRRFGETRRGWLGVTLTNLTPEVAQRAGLSAARGAVVSNVNPGSPAARAGLRQGDIVVRFDGRQPTDWRSLSRMIAETEIGRTVSIDILRGGRPQTVAVEIGRLRQEAIAAGEGPSGLGARPSARARVMGMNLIELSPALRGEYGVGEGVEGVLIVSVDPGSDAAGKVRPGDVIVEMGFEEIASIDAARAVGERAEAAGRPLIVRISRGGDLTVRAIRPN